MSHPGEPPTPPAAGGPTGPPTPRSGASAAPQPHDFDVDRQGRPPQGYPAPHWAQPPVPPPSPPRRDSTRTIAIVALVIGSVALLGQLLSMVVPFLFFSAFGIFSEGFESDGGFAVESALTTIGGGQAPVAADGTVSDLALTSAVRELLGGDPSLPPAGEITCDTAPRVARDTSVLCRADVDRWYGIVRFTDSSGSFEVVSVAGSGWGLP